MAQEQKFPAPFGRCPICGQFMSVEMLPVGLTKKNEKGKQKIMPLFDVALNQTIRWSGEMLARVIASAATAEVASNIVGERHLYYTCNNQECTACYSARTPRYFKKTPLGTFELMGDAVGFTTEILRGLYKAKMKKKKLTGRA